MPSLYFSVGSSSSVNSELWKYDGVAASLVHTFVGTHGQFISCLAPCASTSKIYVNVIDFDAAGFVNGASTIWTLDPNTDILTKIVSYNFVDTQPPSFYGGGQLVPALKYMEDSGNIYFAHQCFNGDGRDHHIVKFNPSGGTVTLVAGPQSDTTSQPEGRGFLAKVGAIYYWGQNGVIYSTATPDVPVSWTLYQDIASSSPFAQIITGGDFDPATGNYLFAAQDGLGQSSVMVYSIDNSGTLTAIYTDAGTTKRKNIYPAALVSSGVYSVVINDGAAGNIFSTPNEAGELYENSGGGWSYIGRIPDIIWNSDAIGRVGYVPPFNGGQGLAARSGIIYAISYYNSTVLTPTGTGFYLFSYDPVGATWAVVQRWAGNDTIHLSGSHRLCVIALAPAATPPPPPPTPVVSPVVPYCPTRAWVILYDTNGNRLAIFDDWKDLNITHKVNNVDTCVFSFDGADSRVDLFGVDYILEVWREVGAYQYIEYQGFVRVFQPQLTTDQHAIFTATTFGLMDLLRRRLVLYQSNTPFTFKSAPGETVMKQIVNENVGPLGNIPIRYLNGVTPGFTVQADAAQGKVWTDSIGNMNVLNVLQGIAQLTNVDFDVVLTGKVPVAFEFRCYYPQRGANLSATVAFSPLLGNMVGPVYTHDYSQEVNSIVVLGPGQDGSRLMLTEVGPDVGASPWNIVEATITASGLPNISGLSDQFIYESMRSHADLMLTNNQPIQTFAFDVLQTDVLAYGRDYRLGDIVSARFGNVSLPLKVIEVGLQIKEGKEDIKITFSNLPARL